MLRANFGRAVCKCCAGANRSCYSWFFSFPSRSMMNQIIQGVRQILASEPGRGRAAAGDDVAKDAIIQQHRECWERARNRDSNPIFSLALELHARSQLPEAPAASAAPLLSLQRILISELKVEEHHVGRVLYGTLRERPWKITAVQSLLEDEAGGLVKVEICHAVPPAAKMSAIEALYPKGLKVAIKEPYFELYGDRSVAVRVDNPADIVVLRVTGNRRTLHNHSVSTGVGHNSRAAVLEPLEAGSNAREQKVASDGQQGAKPSKKKRAQLKKLKAAEAEQADKRLTEVCAAKEDEVKVCVEPGRLAAELAESSLADDHKDSECSVDLLDTRDLRGGPTGYVQDSKLDTSAIGQFFSSNNNLSKDSSPASRQVSGTGAPALDARKGCTFLQKIPPEEALLQPQRNRIHIDPKETARCSLRTP